MSDGLFGSTADWIAIWRAAMEAKELTHRAVDEMAGLGEGYVSKLMCGQRTPTAPTIEKMNRALDIRLRVQADALTP